jgi:PAS domain S-box-containing protein
MISAGSGRAELTVGCGTRSRKLVARAASLPAQFNPACLLISIDDVSDNRVADTYRRQFETALDGILLLDADTGQVIDVNRRMLQWLGYSRSEWLKNTPLSIGVWQCSEEALRAFRTLQEKGWVRFERVPTFAKDGHRGMADIVGNVFQDGARMIIQLNVRENPEHSLH